MKDKVKKSSGLAYMLRHSSFPGESGWVDVETVMKEKQFTQEELNELVFTDSKQRFEYSEDKRFIRACQGHSAKVDMKWEATVPPVILYHGTSMKSLPGIMASGIKPMSRNFVHLSATLEEAERVGRRHKGDTVILCVDAEAMYRDGVEFYVSSNGIWQTKHVNPNYIIETLNPGTIGSDWLE